MRLIEQYETKLREKTTLSEGTIRVYTAILNDYLNSYDNHNTDTAIKYIISKYRNTNNLYAKYALKKYAAYFKTDINTLAFPKLKPLPRKRIRTYINKRLLTKVINNIEEEKYKDIATLQYALVCRMVEILTLRSEAIDLDQDNIIKVRLKTKGNKEKWTFLHNRYRDILERYITKNGVGYLFLDISFNDIDKTTFERKLNVERTTYYRALNKAAKSLGLANFGTHDLRRNPAEYMIQQGKDIRVIQQILGHANINTTMRYFDDNPIHLKDTLMQHQENE